MTVHNHILQQHHCLDAMLSAIVVFFVLLSYAKASAAPNLDLSVDLGGSILMIILKPATTERPATVHIHIHHSYHNFTILYDSNPDYYFHFYFHFHDINININNDDYFSAKQLR
ncbi:hypothetical protein QR680_013978 [Steinernema hermaphroditum]|uniref:Uncharacterized protein n=1 Tax=Steinernema hermaphroditum TaxID=289476 RepID=A0AA39I9L4_9BILA|nr:hypothetical protein QR680_013978 [Steinernema hermaphroditum]